MKINLYFLQTKSQDVLITLIQIHPLQRHVICDVGGLVNPWLSLRNERDIHCKVVHHLVIVWTEY